VASAVGTAAGVVVMIVASALASAADRAAALAAGYGVAFLVSTTALATALRHRSGLERRRATPVIVRVVIAGLTAYAVMTILAGVPEASGRMASLVIVVVVGAVGAVVYALSLRILTHEPLRRLVTIDDA
jgi:hypothetical protein